MNELSPAICRVVGAACAWAETSRVYDEAITAVNREAPRTDAQIRALLAASVLCERRDDARLGLFEAVDAYRREAGQ